MHTIKPSIDYVAMIDSIRVLLSLGASQGC
jgi:hypothetical protein